MVLNNTQIFVLYETLLSLKNKTSDITITAGFNIIKNIKILEPIYEAIAEARLQILLKFGTLNDEGQIEIPQSKIEDANIFLNELGQVKNNVDLSILNLSDLSSLFLTLDEIESLYPIINGEA